MWEVKTFNNFGRVQPVRDFKEAWSCGGKADLSRKAGLEKGGRGFAKLV